MSEETQKEQEKEIELVGVKIKAVDYKTLFWATLLAMVIVVCAQFLFILSIWNDIPVPEVECHSASVQLQRGEVCCSVQNPKQCTFTYDLSSWEKLSDSSIPMIPNYLNQQQKTNNLLGG